MSKNQQAIAIICRVLKRLAERKHTLLGFATLELVDAGVVIRECPVHESHGKRWIGFPARQWAGGWIPMVEFAPNADRESFQRAALAAIDVRAAGGEADAGWVTRFVEGAL